MIECICRGRRQRRDRAALRISTHTVKVYVHAILGKTRAPNRAGLITLLGDCARRDNE